MIIPKRAWSAPVEPPVCFEPLHGLAYQYVEPLSRLPVLIARDSCLLSLTTCGLPLKVNAAANISSLQTSSMASPQISPGTLRTTTRRERSSASSSTLRLHRLRLSSVFPRSSKRSKASAQQSSNGEWSATAGEARLST
jgi:hypothetical protein